MLCGGVVRGVRLFTTRLANVLGKSHVRSRFSPRVPCGVVANLVSNRANRTQQGTCQPQPTCAMGTYLYKRAPLLPIMGVCTRRATCAWEDEYMEGASPTSPGVRSPVVGAHLGALCVHFTGRCTLTH